MIALATVVLALALVPATGGSYRRLMDARTCVAPQFLLLFALQSALRGRFGGLLGDGSIAVFLWGCVSVGLALALFPRRREAGVALMLSGVASNAAVVLVNGRMPVTATASTVRGVGHFYRAVAGGEPLVWMADVLPLPGGFILSLGDLLLLVGVVVYVLAASHRGMPPAEMTGQTSRKWQFGRE